MVDQAVSGPVFSDARVLVFGVMAQFSAPTLVISSDSEQSNIHPFVPSS